MALPHGFPWIASPASRWADLEREFHLAYLDDPEPFPRQAVEVTWMTLPDGYGGPFGFVLGTLGLADDGGKEGMVLQATRQDGATMTLDLEGTPVLAEAAGRSRGIVVGGFGQNAVTCLELGDLTVWPTFNPS